MKDKKQKKLLRGTQKMGGTQAAECSLAKQRVIWDDFHRDLDGPMGVKGDNQLKCDWSTAWFKGL